MSHAQDVPDNDLPQHVPVPDILQDFEMESARVTPYPFKPFPREYVQQALKKGIDWSLDPRGIVTPVKNQGPHGYCGTFGRIQNAEGQYALHSGHPAQSLSVEQLVDCVGWARDQMPSILGLASAKTPGLMSERDYPYNISKYRDQEPPIPGNPCKFKESKIVADYGKRITNMTGVKPGAGEDQLAAFIHHNGPVSTGINANVFKYKDHDNFVSASTCKKVAGQGIDHSIFFVGFGVDPKKGPYWKIKNSWGTKWADKGYVKVARGIKCAGIGSAHGMVPTYGDPAKYYIDNQSDYTVV